MNKKSLFEKIQEDFKPIRFTIEDTPNKTKAAGNMVQNITLIPVSDIQPDPNQPRKTFDQAKLEELATSIKNKGVIQPLIVRPHSSGRYVIVTGERRFKAATIARLTEIPCTTRHFTDEEALICQIIENVQREDLTPIEEARSFQKLTQSGITQSEIASLIGKSQPYVSQLLKILTLPETILQESEQTQISKEHLLQLTKSEKPESTWQEIKQGKTAKEIKNQLKNEKSPKSRHRYFTRIIKPEGKPYKITIQIRKPHAGVQEVIEALKEAITFLTDETNQNPKGGTQ